MQPRFFVSLPAAASALQSGRVRKMATSKRWFRAAHKSRPVSRLYPADVFAPDLRWIRLAKAADGGSLELHLRRKGPLLPVERSTCHGDRSGSTSNPGRRTPWSRLGSRHWRCHLSLEAKRTGRRRLAVPAESKPRRWPGRGSGCPHSPGYPGYCPSRC